MKSMKLTTTKVITAGVLFWGTLGIAKNNSEPQSLLSAKHIVCGSPAMGNFGLYNIRSNAVFKRNRLTPVLIKSIKADSISFEYRDYQQYKFQLVFKKRIHRRDGSGSSYQTLSGFFVEDGREEIEIECQLQ